MFTFRFTRVVLVGLLTGSKVEGGRILPSVWEVQRLVGICTCGKGNGPRASHRSVAGTAVPSYSHWWKAQAKSVTQPVGG